MKNQTTRILSMGIALVAAAAVHAQDKTVTANVPFSFYMGSNMMSAGAYRVGGVSNGGIMWLASMQKGSIKAVTTFSVAGEKESEPARLVFHCYSGNCFLAQIWTGDAPIGRAIGTSPREKELTQNGAAPTLAVIRFALPR